MGNTQVGVSRYTKYTVFSDREQIHTKTQVKNTGDVVTWPSDVAFLFREHLDVARLSGAPGLRRCAPVRGTGVGGGAC